MRWGLFACLAALPLWAEEYRVEVTASWWPVEATGTIQSGVLPVDLETDLGITGFRSHFTGKLVVKPGLRHRITVEGTPYRLGGDNIITREIIFAGRLYQLRDRVVSDAEIDYVAGAYEYEIVSRDRGHFGLGAGAGYVEATGTLRSEASGFSGVENQSFPIPVLQTSFRFSPVWRVHFGGELKGMSLGDYGYFFQATGDAGVGFTRWFGVSAGYRFVDADVHRRSGTRGIALRFSGPLLSLWFRR